MMKMKVVMDEDRIAKEDKYDLMKIYSYHDRLFQKRGMTREEGWYINGTFSSCGAVIINLISNDWFLSNVDEWIWYDEDDGSIEDLKAHYCKKINQKQDKSNFFSSVGKIDIDGDAVDELRRISMV